MIPKDLRKYLNLGAEMHDTHAELYLLDEPLNEEAKARLLNGIKSMSALCTDLELPTSRALMKRAESNLPETTRELEVLTAAIYAELDGKMFFFVPSDRAKYYDHLFRSDFISRFPFASSELVSAGRCLSLSQFTASVFHSMRACEIGVRALSEDMGVQFTIPADLQDWQNHMNQISAKLTVLKGTPRSAKRDEDLGFYSRAAAQLQYFNDGWRVRVAHARARYDEPEAITVFDHAVALFDILVERVKEPGA